MPRWEIVMWPCVCAFMVLWCHNIAAGVSQNQLLFHWPHHGLHRGWLPAWVVELVLAAARAQSGVLRAVLRSLSGLGLYGPEFEHLNSLGLSERPVEGARVGYYFDKSNPQWFSFRDALWYLAPVLLAISLASRYVQRARPSAHRPLMLAVGGVFLVKAHGARALYFLGAAGLNFAVARALPRGVSCVAAAWALNVALLVAVRVNFGFDARWIPGALRAPLDALGGGVRWDVCFNISMLRFISFFVDYGNARRFKEEGARLGALAGAGSPPGDKDAALRDPRAPTSLPLEQYTLGAYAEYLLYPALYIAGPIVSFDNFTRSRLTPPGMLPRRFLVVYAARAALALLCVEVLLHFNYLDYLTKGARAMRIAGLPLHHLGCIGFAYLVFMWLKFLSFWRFFRFFALLDGIPAPENMRRCICNNMSVQSFWREWHTSFYQWLVRYLYVPIGGSRNRLLAVPLVFGFVAFWHEIDVRLVTHLVVWAALMGGFMVPEIVLQRTGFLADRWGPGGYATMRARRWAQALYGSVIITILVAANTAGFCWGGEGLRVLFANALTPQGVRLTLGALVFFFSGAQTMLEVRAHEKRVGHRVWPWDPVDKHGAFQVLR